jgi:hypothetical protein
MIKPFNRNEKISLFGLIIRAIGFIAFLVLFLRKIL